MDGEGTQSAEERPRVAVLVLHGVGQQAKFETVSAFAAGLAERAGVAEVRRTPLLIGDKVESAVTIGLPGLDVDVIEYYYQPLMQRQVAVADVARWLVETGFKIRWLYRTYDFSSPDPKGARERKAEEPGARPGANGDFLKLHYMLRQPDSRALVWLVFGLAKAIRALEALRGVPGVPLVTLPLEWLLGRFVDPVLREVAGDLILYTAFDPRLALSGVRDQVLGGCLDRIERLVKCEEDGRPRYRKVFVAGHSLGSVVAYDAVSRIALRTDHAKASGLRGGEVLSPEEARRIGGLVTFGSPLDKIALMFWPRVEEDPGDARGSAAWRRWRLDIRKGLLAHFHGIGGLSEVLDLPGRVGQPKAVTFDGLPWLNLHHPEDLIAGHLDAFRGVENLQIETPVEEWWAGRRTAEAHGAYWHHPAVYEWLLARFAEGEETRPVDQVA